MHVHYVNGLIQTASLQPFVNDSQNSLCINSPGSVPTKSCPDVGYECGFLDEKIAVYAHLVGQVGLQFYYRDCVQIPKTSVPHLGCLDTKIEEVMFMMLWDLLPISVISQQPEGYCYCRRVEGCEPLQRNGTNGGAACPSKHVMLFNKW